MSIERSTLQLESVDGRSRSWLGEGPRRLALAKKYFDLSRLWMRRAMAPGGITGIVMALVFVVVTDGFLLMMRSIQELPPVALTFLIPIVVAAIRWGTLSAAVTAMGGAATV